MKLGTVATGKIGQNVTVDNLEIGTVAHEI